MKKVVQYLIAIVLTAVYCIAVDVSNHSYLFKFTRETPNSWEDSSIMPLPTDFLFFAPENKTTFAIPNDDKPTGFKKQSNLFSATAIANSHLVRMWFSQYTILSGKVLSKYRKTDIIFPFHNFW